MHRNREVIQRDSDRLAAVRVEAREDQRPAEDLCDGECRAERATLVVSAVVRDRGLVECEILALDCVVILGRVLHPHANLAKPILLRGFAVDPVVVDAERFHAGADRRGAQKVLEAVREERRVEDAVVEAEDVLLENRVEEVLLAALRVLGDGAD